MAPRTPNEVLNQPESSFPGIWKYPRFRDIPNMSAEDWITAKQKDDDIGNLWRVHDKLYDLTPFIPNHPGGADWLIMTQGTDITEAFETSHVANVNLVETTLAKFFVSDAKEPRISPYTFEEKGFYKTLKRRIEPIMKEAGTQSTRTMLLMEDSLVSTFIVLALLGTWMDSTLIRVIAGVVLALTLIGAHNFFHLKDTWRQYYFDIGLISSYEWRIAHALSHHLYPNTLLDIELFLFPGYEFLPNRQKTFIMKYGPRIYGHLLFFIGFPMDFIKRISNVIKGHQKWRSENGIVIAELVILCCIAPTILSGIWSWIIIQSVSSFVFLEIGSTAAHHHPEIYHDGDEARPNPDFGLCQLDATRERAGDFHKNSWVILLTFGNHCLHHLFPTVCHSKLPLLRPAFEQTLKDFSEAFPPMFQWDLYRGCFQQLARTETSQFPYIKDKKLN